MDKFYTLGSGVILGSLDMSNWISSRFDIGDGRYVTPICPNGKFPQTVDPFDQIGAPNLFERYMQRFGIIGILSSLVSCCLKNARILQQCIKYLIDRIAIARFAIQR